MATVIVKPTHNCNMRCRYCYIPPTAERGRMSSLTLQNTIEKPTRFTGKKFETHFIWHGGEPLLVGLPFYQKAVQIEGKLETEGYNISNGIQTNGTLLNGPFLDFFEEHKFGIGLSLDGPEEIHNKTRYYLDGRGTFKDTYRAIQAIKRRQNPRLGCGVICVLNKTNIGDIDTLYQFFHDEEINVKFNPLIKCGRATEHYRELSINPEEYGQVLIWLFDRWFYDKDPRIDVEPLRMIMGNIMTGIPDGCNFGDSCQRHFISIGPTGSVYPCGRFDGIPEFCYGNINTDNMEQIEKHKVRESLKHRGADTVRECITCGYREICHAGCMHDAYTIKGNPMDKDFYCAGHKMIFKHITDALHKELAKAEVSSVTMKVQSAPVERTYGF